MGDWDWVAILAVAGDTNTDLYHYLWVCRGANPIVRTVFQHFLPVLFWYVQKEGNGSFRQPSGAKR